MPDANAPYARVTTPRSSIYPRQIEMATSRYVTTSVAAQCFSASFEVYIVRSADALWLVSVGLTPILHRAVSRHSASLRPQPTMPVCTSSIIA